MRTIATLLLLIGLGACSDDSGGPAGSEPAAGTASSTASAVEVTSTAPGPLTPLQTQRWSSSCALCHVSGEAGAPIVGDAAAWQPRLAQGRDTLLTHTLEGLNDMPPLGYCMACEREDFIAMIDFMAGELQ